MGVGIDEVLERYVSVDDYARLIDLSGGRLRELFVYDGHQRCFEPAERSFQIADLEAVLRASEVLTAHRDKLDTTRFRPVTSQKREKHEVQYRFGPGETQLYEVFKTTLEREMARSDAVTVEEGAGLDGPILTITISSTTENEYRQTKDYLQWLYDLAKRSISRRPYEGHRPY